jgi:3-oxoacyl-[acyl-carrier protein] reductase
MKAVVVTGASRGIGRAVALELSARDVTAVLLSRPSRALDETRTAIRAAGGREVTVECDLADPDSVESAARGVLDAVGAPAALVNNAGVIHRAKVEQLTLAQFDEQLAVNVRAPFCLTRALLPAMRAAGRGAIVNVSSIAGTLGTSGASAYCASKWGLIGFTKALAEELRDSGLMAVAVLPGSVDTRMLEGSGFEPRMTAADVARTIAYLALDAPVAHNGGVVEMFGT